MGTNASQCVILVGGQGTRLGSLAADRPKPLVEVDGRPFLETLIGEASRRGFSKILLLAGHRSSQVAQFVNEVGRSGLFSAEIKLSTERTPLGTAGAIRNAASHLDEEFLLLNGDSWFDFNWLDFIGTLSTQPLAVLVLALRRELDASRYDVVELKGNRIVGFRKGGTNESGLINGGVYVCRRTLLDHLPERGSLEVDVLPKLAADGRVVGRVYKGSFIDIGIPEALSSAQVIVPHAKRRPAAFFDRDAVVRCVNSNDDLIWSPGAIDAIKWLNDHAFYVFIVTNQVGVSNGQYREEEVHRVQTHIASRLRAAGASVDDFCRYPQHSEGSVERYRHPSRRRRPGPGMIQDVIKCWPIDTARSILIGDKGSDVAVAHMVGIRGYLFEGGNLCQMVTRIANLV